MKNVVLNLTTLSIDDLKRTLEEIKTCNCEWKQNLTVVVTNYQEARWREAGYGSIYGYLKDLGCNYWYIHTLTEVTVLPFNFNVVPTCYREKGILPTGCITIRDFIESQIPTIAIDYPVLTEGPFTGVGITTALDDVFGEIAAGAGETVRGEELVAAGTTETGTTNPIT